MQSTPPNEPFLLVLDPTPTFSPIIKATLRREAMQLRWFLSRNRAWRSSGSVGKWIEEKWQSVHWHHHGDEYPDMRPPTMAIISLAFPAKQCNRILALLLLQEPRPHLFTTSTIEELSTNQSQEYWRHAVSHIPRPLKIDDVLERLIPFVQR